MYIKRFILTCYIDYVCQKVYINMFNRLCFLKCYLFIQRFYLIIYLFNYLVVYLFTYVFIYLITYLFVSLSIYLFMWLSFLYSFLYYSRVVYPIFPNYPKSKKLVLEMDGDFFSDSLDIYYGVKRPGYEYNPAAKKNKSMLFYYFQTN